MAQEMAVFGPPSSEAKFKVTDSRTVGQFGQKISESALHPSPFSLWLFFVLLPSEFTHGQKTLFSSLFYNGI